jgi:hypothetical protein
VVRRAELVWRSRARRATSLPSLCRRPIRPVAQLHLRPISRILPGPQSRRRSAEPLLQSPAEPSLCPSTTAPCWGQARFTLAVPLDDSGSSLGPLPPGREAGHNLDYVAVGPKCRVCVAGPPPRARPGIDEILVGVSKNAALRRAGPDIRRDCASGQRGAIAIL